MGLEKVVRESHEKVLAHLKSSRNYEGKLLRSQYRLP